MPDWLRIYWLKGYWFCHVVERWSPARGRGYIDMSGEGIIRFLATEAVLIIVAALCVWGVSKTDWDGQAKKLIGYLIYVLFGAAILIVLFRFLAVV